MKKNLDYYLQLHYQPVIVPDMEEGGFGAYYPDLPGCVTCGETAEETLRNAEDAKREWISSMLEDNMPVPEPGEYRSGYMIAIPEPLKRKLYDKAKTAGKTVSEYCIDLLSGTAAR